MLDDLLQLLINAVESIEFVPAPQALAARQLVDRTTRKRVSLKIVEFESTRKYETERGRLSYQDLSRSEQLAQLCEILTSSYGQPVLFIVDELDRMVDTRGLASVIKAYGKDVTFLLVGISSSLSELLADHQSLERRLVPVGVELMSRRELREVIDQAEQRIRDNGLTYKFTPEAKSMLVKLAGGFPWFIHVLAQAALIRVADNGKTAITSDDVAWVTAQIVSNRFAQQFSDMYQNAVRDSRPRELALRCFAKWSAIDIPTSEIYPVLKMLGISNPSVYKGQLNSEQYGNILHSPAFQSRGLVRFQNEMFKVYVKMRRPIYTRVSEEIDEAWAARQLD